MFAKPPATFSKNSFGFQMNSNNSKRNNVVNTKPSIVNEEMLQAFREKRKARFEQLRAKAIAQREKPTSDNTIKHATSQTKSIKKVPVVKQTLASKLRMEKANPLLTLSPNTIAVLKDKISSNLKNAPINDTGTKTTHKSFNKENLKIKNVNDKREIKMLNQRNVKNIKTNYSVDNCANNASSVSAATTKSTNSSTLNIKKNKKPLRRSLTTVHLKKLGNAAANKCVKSTYKLKAQSTENINHSFHKVRFQSPIVEDPYESVQFVTPSRKSKMFNAAFNSSHTPAELRQQLLKWLEKRGQSLENYSHLRCFGVHQATPYKLKNLNAHENKIELLDDENKENVESNLSNITINESGIYKIADYSNLTTNEDLFGFPEPEKSKEEIINITNGILNDLHLLISEKYPTEQSKAWLHALKKKYPIIVEQPLYWECRAALEEFEGELTRAVECYQSAIVHGAEEKKIDKALENMLEKFSILNLDSTIVNNTSTNKHRKKMVCDARNVFKSSVIKFAVQQRKEKKKENSSMKFTVTPVRRSTRLSRTSYASTPNVELFSSIQEISSPIKSSMNFESNSALCN